MGVIYSSAELSRGHIPSECGHIEAAQSLVSEVPRLGGVVLTIVHGSVSEGRFNMRSDLDVAVTYIAETPADEYEVVDGIKAVLDRTEQKTHVKVESNIWPTDEPIAARSERMYDRLFANHLADSMLDANWSIGLSDSMISKISAMPVNIDKVMYNYLTYKHGGVTKAPRYFNSADSRSTLAMQRILELPKALGRKVAQSGGDLHPECTDGFQGALESVDMSDTFRDSVQTLRTIDGDYSGLLKDYVSLGPTISCAEVSEYEAWLADRYRVALAAGVVAVSSFTRHFAQSS
ncbi:hypothetical protein HGB25_02265 [Candidatus Saccharibacteria bacterium]|nr:hypothetical protein [Candidatus Saccharibacteria bacterium]